MAAEIWSQTLLSLNSKQSGYPRSRSLMSFPEEIETNLVELGINVSDYKTFRAAQLRDIIPSLQIVLGSRTVRGIAA